MSIPVLLVILLIFIVCTIKYDRSITFLLLAICYAITAATYANMHSTFKAILYFIIAVIVFLIYLEDNKYRN